MSHSEENQKGREPTIGSRRKFLSLIPLGIFGAIAASLGLASKRFLEPQTISEAAENWKVLGQITELSGQEPIARTISVESPTGWSKTIEDLTVYILPKHDNRVLSSVCPHEGCPVVWEPEKKNFLCPCHDSFFQDDGTRLSGPVKSDLRAFQSKVENGNLHIKL